MTEACIEDLSGQEYRELLEAVREPGMWCWDADFSQGGIDEVAGRAAESRFSAEVRFRHTVSDAVLYLRLPEPGTPPFALKGFLEQPFDPGLSPSSGFARQLGKAHSVIARQPVNQYLSSIQSCETVLSINVPPEYSLPVLKEAVAVAGRISFQIEALHREIRRPIEAVNRHD